MLQALIFFLLVGLTLSGFIIGLMLIKAASDNINKILFGLFAVSVSIGAFYEQVCSIKMGGDLLQNIQYFHIHPFDYHEVVYGFFASYYLMAYAMAITHPNFLTIRSLLSISLLPLAILMISLTYFTSSDTLLQFTSAEDAIEGYFTAFDLFFRLSLFALMLLLLFSFIVYIFVSERFRTVISTPWFMFFLMFLLTVNIVFSSYTMGSNYFSPIYPCSLSLFILIFGYRVLNFDDPFLGDDVVLEEDEDAVYGVSAYITPSFTNEVGYLSHFHKGEYQNILQQMNEIMIHQKPFLDKYFTMDMLVCICQTNRNYLSEAINSMNYCSFNEYINYQRIQYFKEQFVSRPYVNVVDLASQSGFINAELFNKYFRYFEGITPEEYLEKSKEQALIT